MNLVPIELDVKSILVRISNVVFDADDDLDDVTSPYEFVAKHGRAIRIGSVRGTDAHKMPGIRVIIKIR
jgi:hypothetical protein